MIWLARLFQGIGDLFYLVYFYMGSAAQWIQDTLGWSGLANIFWDTAFFFFDVFLDFYNVADAVQGLWEWVVAQFDYLETLASLINSIIAWVQDVPSEIRAYITAQLDDVVNWVKAVQAEVSNYVDAEISAVIEWVENLPSLSLDVIATLINKVKDWVTSRLQELSGSFLDYMMDVTAWVLYRLPDITSWTSKLAGEMWADIKSFIGTALGIPLAELAPQLNLISQWFDSIQEFFNDPWGWLEAQFDAWFDRNW